MSTEIVTIEARDILIQPVVEPAQMMAYHKQIADFVAKSLEKDKDYGQLPGTQRSCLYKAGSERLLVGFGCVADFEVIESEADHNRPIAFTITKWIKANDPGRDEKERLKAEGQGRNKKIANGSWEWQVPITEEGHALGLYRYVVKCRILQRSTGEVVGTGLGTCSTVEGKYIRSPREAENTVLKMAKKRAQVDAVLSTFGLSDRFTQDIEDIAPEKLETPKAAPEPETPKAEPSAVELAMDEVSEYLTGLGFGKRDAEKLQNLCRENGYRWINKVLSAKKAGLESAEQVFEFCSKTKEEVPA